LLGKGFVSMDAGIEPSTWMVLQRPLTGTPVPNFNLRWVYFDYLEAIERGKMPHRPDPMNRNSLFELLMKF